MNQIDEVDQQCFSLKNIVNRTLNLTHSRSFESAVLATKIIGITVSTRYGNLENVEFNTKSMLIVTIFSNKRKGSAYSNDFNDKSIFSTVDAAVNIARYTDPDSYSGIADKKLLAFNIIDLDLYHPIKLDTNLGVELASTAERIALEYDDRIICTEGGKFNSCVTIKVFGNSHGMLQSYNATQHSLCCSVIAESNGNMEQNYAYTLSRSFNDLHSSEWVGKECARRTLKCLNSRKIKTMEIPVLFSADVAVSLFEHLAHAICGDNVYRKSTFLFNELGNQIFPDWLSIKECPHILKGLGSAPFDSEGVQTSERIIIKDGVLNSWILNSYSARRIGMQNTGNADGIYNWCVSNKNINFIELIKNMHRGLIVTNVMGPGVNIITGNYSRGVSGFWVENDSIQYPVNEITIASNLKEMFFNIVAISDDIESRGHIRCGSVLISVMKISGI